MAPDPYSQDQSVVLNVTNSDLARAEVRQFLVALSALAFLMAAMGLPDGGPQAFAADIVLVLCGGWCANQLIRGSDVFKEQVICVIQAYFTGLLCCSILLFLIGWMVFLPSEFLHLGNSLLFAATFSTNFQLAFFPAAEIMRFDGLLDHLWVPALIAQCCAILFALCMFLQRNLILLLTVMSVLAIFSLSVSTSQNPIIQLLPVGGLWAFLGGAIPFLAANRYPVLRYALLLGIFNLVTGIVAAITTGDSLFARAFLALSFAFLYLGSRPRKSLATETKSRRQRFGLALHIFLWALPLAHVTAALNIMNPSAPNYVAWLVPCLFLAIVSWTIWKRVEERVALSRVTPSGVIALILLANGIATLSSQGLQLRYGPNATALVHALESTRTAQSCPKHEEGPLAGLNVCRIGPKGQPTVLIWGDHQLAALRPGFEEAAKRANVSSLLVTHPGCVPLHGLQTRFANAGENTGRLCDQQSEQVLQAIPHLTSITQVTIVADWLYYTQSKPLGFEKRAQVRLGPIDGTPINVAQQAMYVEQAINGTVKHLTEQGLRVSVVRQVPAQPGFDAEIAARAEAPGAWLYTSLPEQDFDVTIEDATNRHEETDQMFLNLSTQGQVHYVNTWDAFCSASRCSTRGGLSSEYVSATTLTRTGALALAPLLAQDLKRSRTHIAHRVPFGS